MYSLSAQGGDVHIDFKDFFDVDEIQRIQDGFAQATGVASIITTPGGIPMTRPSNFTRLCRDVIRATETGCRNCIRSDALVGAYEPGGPTVRRCASGGLWDAGVSISVNGRHVANWLIGQVRCTLGDEARMLAYADIIGADPEVYREALAEVPYMEEAQFRRVADSLYLIANSLCEKAYERTLLLREKRERHERDAMRRTLMSCSRDGIAIIDQQYRVIEANRRFAEMLCYSQEETEGLRVWDYDALLGEAAVREFFGDLSLVNTVFETRYRRRDGSVFDVEVSTAGATIGERSCVIAICRDISGRKETERLLRESERHFRALFELSQDGFVLVDREGRFLNANGAYCRMTGYSLPELRALGDFYAITPQRWHEWERTEIWGKMLLSKGGTGVYQKEYIHKSGHVFPVELRDSAVFDDDGHIAYAWSIVRDISDRMRAEQELVKREAGFRKILDTLPQLVSYVGNDMRYRFVNAAYVALFPGRNIVGKTVAELIGQAAFEKTRGMVEQVLGGKTVHFSSILPYPEVGERFIDGYLVPDYSEDDEVVGYYAILNDLSHLKKVEDSLRRAKDEAETANKLKSEFLANMSHEIRTPLNGILGMLQLLETTVLDGQQRKFLQSAITSSGRLTRLLSDILDISQIEADRLVLRERCFDIADIGEALADLFRQKIDGKSIVYAFRRTSGVPGRVVGDDARLLQVLFNLVGNSLKFTESGCVVVTVSSLPFRAGAPHRLLFSVHDTGSGIPEGMLCNVFEPFIQIDGSNTRRHQGVGLGLSIARKLVQRMGGTMCIESRAGKGTSIYASLPFRMPEAPAKANDRGAGCQPDVLQGLRVLMVEDDEVNLLCGTRLLERAGCEVTVARNGREALDTLRARQVDLVLMDIQMPVMDGLQAVDAIRHSEHFSHLADMPVIALTAHAMAGDRERFLAAGMDGYLSKPFDIHKVVEEMARVVRDRRSQSAPAGP